MSNVVVASVPVMSRSWYTVLDCADGCGYSCLCVFVFAGISDVDYASSEARRILGDAFPSGSTLYPVYGHWLDFLKSVHVLFTDYRAFFTLAFDADRLTDWVSGRER